MAEGDIGSILDTFVFYAGTHTFSDIIHVSGDVFAIVYSSADEDGYIVTVSISDAGVIGDPVLDRFEFDTVYCKHPNIIHVSGDVYAIVYSGPDWDGFVTTVSISAAGVIGDPVLDTFEFYTSSIYYPNIIHVFGDVYAIVYVGAVNHGFVTTVSISEAGVIGDPVLDSFQFDPVSCGNPRLIHVSGVFYAICSQGGTYPGQVTTISISVAGEIGAAIIDVAPYDATSSVHNRIVGVSSNVFAVVYRGPDYDGWLATIGISDAGDINPSAIENWEYDVVRGDNPNIIHISGTVFLVAHNTGGAAPNLITFNISDAGDIDPTIISNFNFPAPGASYIEMIHISGDVYAFTFRGNINYGTLVTIGIETVLPTAARHELIMGIG